MIASTFIGNVNPFRYRGYYYDTETGFYYLQTRYYDPTICRFINADNYELIATLSSMPNQLNMYAYCGNNPIMFTDESGEAWIAILISAVLGAVFSGATVALEQSRYHSIDWLDVGVAAAFGAVSGAFAVTGIWGTIGQFFIQGGLAVCQTLTETAIDNSWSEFSIWSLTLDFFVSGAMGSIGAKSSKIEFRRFWQIERSLIQSLKRGAKKSGIKGIVFAIKSKSGKYLSTTKDLIKDTIEKNIIDIGMKKFIMGDF